MLVTNDIEILVQLFSIKKRIDLLSPIRLLRVASFVMSILTITGRTF